MKIRRYTCKNMQEALLKVKMDLGNEAVIMNSRKVRRKGLIGLFTKPLIEVVAAIDDDYAKPRAPAWNASATGVNGSRYYENTYQPERAAGAFSQAPAYGREQAPYQPQDNYQAVPKPQAMVQPQPQPQYPYPSQQEPQKHYTQTNPYQTHHQTQSHMPSQMQHQPQPQSQSQSQPQEQTQPQLQAQVQAQLHSQAQPQAHPQPQAQFQPFQPVNVTPAGAGLSGIHPAENTRLSELETKVKSMETLLEQIYHTVREKSQPVRAGFGGETTVTSASSAHDSLAAVRKTLTEMELDSKLINKIMDKLRERGGHADNPEMALAHAANIMTFLLGEPETIQLRSDGRPQVVIFVGPTGVGKTTTLAKIAADFTLNKQKKVGLITADTYRIAAVEQLKTYSEILNIPFLVVYSPSEVKEAIKMFADKDLILIDTAGRSHRNKSHFDELKALVNSAEADEAYLVVSANTSKHAMNEILEYYSFIKDYKLLFTKLDEAPAPGVIVNARYLTGRPLSYTTAGQSVPDDLNVANPRAIVANLLGSGKIQ